MNLRNLGKLVFGLLFVALRVVRAETGDAAIKTNGNGGSTDVGIWYCANWDANGGGWWRGSTYRPLLPDGTYGMHDGSDPAVIDFHLQKLAEAEIDFILFDDTNGDFNGYGRRHTWIKEKSKAVCARIKLWNESHSWKIKYAFGIGSFFIGDQRRYPTATSYDVIEQQARCVAQEVWLNRNYDPDDYYQIDGKPLLVVLDYHTDARDRWVRYSGAKDWANRFSIRWAGTSGQYSVAAGDYGWAMNAAGVLLHPEVEYLQPGHDNHLPGRDWMHTLRRNGDYYVNNWDRILNHPLPRIVMIGAFNDYSEDSAVWTADTSIDYPKARLPIERWSGHDGQLHPSMYWDYTVGIIRTLRHGAPKPVMAGSLPAPGTATGSK